MTEAELLIQGQNPKTILTILQRKKATDRKLRLFAAACCRHVWSLLPHHRQGLVEAIEQFAEGLIGKAELKAARGSWMVGFPDPAFEGASPDCWSAAHHCADKAMIAVGADAWHACEQDGISETATLVRARDDARAGERKAQATMLRDIFGYLAQPIVVDPTWLGWRAGTIPQLAQSVYDERRFQDLPILADALEEAGCTDAAILGHLRGPGPHVRGCWVVDLLLGKQ